MKKHKVRKVTKKIGPVGVKSSDEIMPGSVQNIPIDNGKAIQTYSVMLSPEDSRAVFQSVAHVICLRDAQYKLKGTAFYSSAIERELSRFSDTKLMPVFKQQGDRAVTDGVDELATMFSKSCDHLHQLSSQPEAVKRRFEREYVNLLISCGINP